MPPRHERGAAALGKDERHQCAQGDCGGEREAVRVFFPNPSIFRAPAYSRKHSRKNQKGHASYDHAEKYKPATNRSFMSPPPMEGLCATAS